MLVSVGACCGVCGVLVVVWGVGGVGCGSW